MKINEGDAGESSKNGLRKDTHLRRQDILPLLKDAQRLGLKNSLEIPVTIERKKRGPSCKSSERTTSVMLNFTKLEQSL